MVVLRKVFFALAVLTVQAAFAQTTLNHLPTHSAIPSGGACFPSNSSLGSTAAGTSGEVQQSNGTSCRSWATDAGITPIAYGTVFDTASGSTAAPSAITTGLTHVIDVRAYGARCDAPTTATDDSAAWQSAINAAAAVLYYEDISPNSPLSVILQGCQTGQSIIKTTLNFTAFTGNYRGQPAALAFTVDMTGSCLIGQTNGAAVINALGARFINWRNLCIYGANTRTPNVGIQIGRNSTLESADTFYFDHPIIIGEFALAAFYNFASESNIAVDAFLQNWYPSGTPYALIEDGFNHFGISNASANSRASMGQNTWIRSNFLGSSVGHAIWIGGVSGMYFRDSYAGNQGTSTLAPVVLYAESTNSTDIVMDMHMEAGSNQPAENFLISGPNSGPTIIGFEYRDYFNEATGSIFKMDTGVSSFTLSQANIDIAVAESTPPIFDTAANYTFSGNVRIPNSSMWTSPQQFSGSLCFGELCAGYQNIGAISNTSVGAYPPNFASTITGKNNTFFGYHTGTNLTSGNQNTAIGAGAFFGNGGAPNTGSYNTAVGSAALYKCQGACGYNVALGSYTGNNVTTGTHNTFLGTQAGSSTTTGVNNIIIGYAAEGYSAISSAEINIGNLLYYNSSGTAAPTISACGTTNGTMDSHANSRSGTVTAGTGGSPMSCTLTFATSYNTWIHCRVTPHGSYAGFTYGYTTSAITLGATAIASDVFDYDCDGY